MSRLQTDRHALVRAAIASLALHLLAVPFFAVTSAPRGSGAASDETTTNETTHVTYLTLETRSAPRRDGAARSTSPRRASVSGRRTREPKRLVKLASKSPQILASALNAPKVPFARGEALASHRISRATLTLTLETASPELSAATHTPAIVSPTDAPANPTAQRTPAAAAANETPLAVATASDGAIAPGGWGQSFAKPLVADDDVLADLRARYRGVRAIAIDVDASGRATHVALPDTVTGEARAELARALLALRYVPAECNGLRCTGTLELAL